MNMTCVSVIEMSQDVLVEGSWEFFDPFEFVQNRCTTAHPNPVDCTGFDTFLAPLLSLQTPVHMTIRVR